MATSRSTTGWSCISAATRSAPTNYLGQTSALWEISASVIQGSDIGPASYVVTAADLHSVTPGNSLCKYAHDT